jgi:hypothetical protein
MKAEGMKSRVIEIKADQHHGLYIVQSGRALDDIPEQRSRLAGTAGRAAMTRKRTLAWTKKTPKKEGWYWYRDDDRSGRPAYDGQI